MKSIREKIHRLPAEVYQGCQIVSITACVHSRDRLFVTDSTFKVFQNILLNELECFDCSAHTYIFMPDHLHLVLSGNKDSSDIKNCLKLFKQKTGFWLSQNKPKFRWQKDYYDHILRSNENLEVHIRYILNNPVRAGIVDYWKKYPYKGSTVYNLNEWD